MAVLRRIQPSSILSPEKEAYEYLLVWLSPFGGVRQWLFSHTDGGQEDSFGMVQVESLSDIRSVPNEEENEVEVLANTLTREDFDYITSIFKSNRVYLVSKAGVQTPVALLGGKKSKPNTLKNYSVKITFRYKEPDLLDV